MGRGGEEVAAGQASERGPGRAAELWRPESEEPGALGSRSGVEKLGVTWMASVAAETTDLSGWHSLMAFQNPATL